MRMCKVNNINMEGFHTILPRQLEELAGEEKNSR